MMNLKNSFIVFVSLCLLVGFANEVSAQKYEKAKQVEYFQLPTYNDGYKTVKIFVKNDNALSNGSAIGGEEGKKKAFGVDFGKLAGKLGDKIGGEKPEEERNTKAGKAVARLKLGEAMQQAVAEAMKSKAVPHETWNLFPPHFSNGKGQLKVVVTYCPYKNARPMKPFKSSKGIYTVPYKVFAHLKVFDANNKLVTDRNFGIVSGIGHSDEWPESGGKMLEVKMTDEGENAHPYDDVCRDGALEQARRVVYGMYGIKKIKENLGVYSFKEIKDSKDYSKKYEKLIENKEEALLNPSEIKEMKEMVSYWNGLIDKVSSDQKWAVHHNLAMGYAWLLNAEKTKEHVSTLKKLHKPTLNKIQKFFSGNAEKGTLVGNKDLKRLEVFNACYPFMEFYAKGINEHTNWPSILDKPYEEILYTFVLNNLVTSTAKLPFPLPIIPSSNLNSKAKSVSGSLYKKGELLMEYSYKLKKGKIESVAITTPKGKGKYKRDFSFRGVFDDGADSKSFGNSRFTLRGVRADKPIGVTPKGYYMLGKFQNSITDIPVECERLDYWYIDGDVDVTFLPNSDNFEEFSSSGLFYVQTDTWNSCGGKVRMISTDSDKDSCPNTVKILWSLWGWGKNKNQAANDFLKKIPGSKWNAKEGIYTYEKSQTYNLDWDINDNGDWTEVTFDDFKVTRSIK